MTTIKIFSKRVGIDSTDVNFIFEYESDVIPCVGDFILYDLHKTFKVNERGIVLTTDNVDRRKVCSVDIYGVIL
jgi:hypothetical protein